MSDVVEKMQRIIASYNCTADQMCGDCPCKDTADRILSEILTPVRERLAEADEANRRVSDENERLRESMEIQRAAFMDALNIVEVMRVKLKEAIDGRDR